MEWKKAVLDQNALISDAIRILDEAALRIVLVVDSHQVLVGTVTDGDVRRGLIKHTALTDPVTSIMNTAPITVTTGNTRDSILSLMQRLEILQIPVVDVKGRVEHVEFLQELTGKPTYNNPVLLMAGGFGKRLHPLTVDMPKPMLKVGQKPILESIIQQVVNSGFQNLYIAIHYKGDQVRDYFGDGSKWGARIKYLEEESPLGTGGALSMLPNDVSKMPVLLMNGDLLTSIDFGRMLTFHNEHKADITMCVREFEFEIPYGVVDVRNQKIVGIKEKPVEKYFVNGGIYVLSHNVISGLDCRKPVDMPELITKHLSSGEKVSAFPIHEYWLDIGLMKQYEQAQVDIDSLNCD